ncbi:hypothetical protein TRV_05373, partial [Trichophyton verrucosum HKI 0517]
MDDRGWGAVGWESAGGSTMAGCRWRSILGRRRNELATLSSSAAASRARFFSSSFSGFATHSTKFSLHPLQSNQIDRPTMAPELRKRKAPAPAPVAEPKAKRGSKAGAKAEPKKAAPKEKKAAAAAAAAAPPAEPEKADKKEEKKEEETEEKKEEEKKEDKGEEAEEKAAGCVPEEGDVLDLSQFEIEIELNDGTKTSFRKLLEESKEGVV